MGQVHSQRNPGPFTRVRGSMSWRYTTDLESSWGYRALWILALLTGYVGAYAQPDLSRSLPPLPEGYWLQLEEVTTHVGGELDGMTTYRLYVNCLNALDFVSSCSGDENNPLALTSSASPAWYNSTFASGWNAQAVNPAFFSFFPDIAYDSYLTIGAEDGSYASAYQCSGQWGDINVPDEFNDDGPGESILLNDEIGGVWYGLFPGLEEVDAHPAFAGDDLRVMVAQLTTAGEVSGQIQVQVFQNGSQANELREVLPILTEAIPGCLDPSAFNFNPEANLNSPSLCNYYCAEGTRFDSELSRCDLEAWLGETGDTQQLDPCYFDFDASGWMDITDLVRFALVQDTSPGVPQAPCGAGTFWDADAEVCRPAPATLGEGNGLGNLNPRYFDLNGDGALNTADFLGLLDAFGKPCG